MCFELANEWRRGEDILVVGVGQMTGKDFDAGRMVVVAWWLTEIEGNESSRSSNTDESG